MLYPTYRRSASTVQRLLFLALLALAALVARPAAAHINVPPEVARSYEALYMQSMIDHHAMAVEMGEICLKPGNASHPELRTLCSNVVKTQTQEIQQMQAWLRDWYNINYAPRMSPADQQMLRELDALNGADFEKTFMREMSDHHWMAIEMTVLALPSFAHAPLVDMGLTIIHDQAAEIQELRTWLRDWYRIDYTPQRQLLNNWSIQRQS